MFGPRRQFSWEEHGDGDGGAALSSLPAPSPEDHSSSRQAAAQELAQYAEGLMAVAGAAPAEYAALVHQAAQEQLSRLADSRGWLAAALQGGSLAPTRSTLSLPASLAAAGGAAPAEVQQALEQVQELDALLEELANKAQPTVAATAGGPLGLSGPESSAPQGGSIKAGADAPFASYAAASARDGRGSEAPLLPGGLEALLRQERARQQHAALVQRALQEGEGSEIGGVSSSAVLELTATMDEREEFVELEQVLGPEEEKLLEALLRQDDTTVLNGSAFNPFDLAAGVAGAGSACSQEVRRLAAIDARLADLRQQEAAELGASPPGLLQGVSSVTHTVPGLAAMPPDRARTGRASAEGHGQNQVQPGKGLEQEQEAEVAASVDADGMLACARAQLQRARQEAAQELQQMVQIDTSLRALLKGAGPSQTVH